MSHKLFQFDVQFCLDCQNYKTELSNLISFQRGIYFWFASVEGLRALDMHSHISQMHSWYFHDQIYYLVYVGIGPKTANNKKQFIKERINNCHLGNRISTSTLRFAIASLLNFKGCVSKKANGKEYSLKGDNETLLNEFLRKEFCIGITKHNTPWTEEESIIKLFEPPLNTKDNKNGWNYAEMKKRRSIFRNSAISLSNVC